MKTTFVVTIAVSVAVAAAIAQSPVRPSTRCVTPEDSKDPTRALPSGPEGRGNQKSDCKASDYKVSGNTATWKTVCTSPPMTGNSEMTFTDDAYNGTMKMESPQGAMTMKIAGKRLGDCK